MSEHRAQNDSCVELIGAKLTILDGGGGGRFYLEKMLNNKNFRQAEGLPEHFTEPNLVLHVF